MVVIVKPAFPVTFNVVKLVSDNCATVCVWPADVAFVVTVTVPTPFAEVWVVAASAKLIVPNDEPVEVAASNPTAVLFVPVGIPKVSGNVALAPVDPVIVYPMVPVKFGSRANTVPGVTFENE